MAQKPLLSICIPTYNREKQLNRLLDSIVSQKGFSNEVEIVISDGPSEDNTQKLVELYQNKYNNIKYYRNNINIGMTAALIEVIEHSEGEYSWMFGSDDQMNTLALKHMLDVIKKEKPKLILSTLFYFNNKRELKDSIQNNKFEMFNGFYALTEYMGSNRYEKNKLGFEQHFTFMSVFCFETLFFREGLYAINKEKGYKYIINNYFNYIYVLYSFLKEGKIILFQDNLILVKLTNNCMRKFKWKIYKDLRDLFDMIKLKYNPKNDFIKFQRKIKLYIILLYIRYRINYSLEKIGLTNNVFYKFIRKTILQVMGG